MANVRRKTDRWKINFLNMQHRRSFQTKYTPSYRIEVCFFNSKNLNMQAKFCALLKLLFLMTNFLRWYVLCCFFLFCIIETTRGLDWSSKWRVNVNLVRDM